jgi:acyl-CoA thioester hydrolase
MISGTVHVRVYWEDTDAGGVVYHASYLRFMERGRTELLRERGIDQTALKNESGLVFVISAMNINFRVAAKMDDHLVVETTITELGGASIVMQQKIMRGADLIAEADVTCAVLSPDGKPARIPADVRTKLS